MLDDIPVSPPIDQPQATAWVCPVERPLDDDLITHAYRMIDSPMGLVGALHLAPEAGQVLSAPDRRPVCREEGMDDIGVECGRDGFDISRFAAAEVAFYNGLCLILCCGGTRRDTHRRG